MESTVVSLFSDYKHGKRFKSQSHATANTTKNNTRAMPSLPRSKPREAHPSMASFHQVEVSHRLRCTTTPPPSLQSQSLPRICLHGNHTRQRNHHGNSNSNHLPEKNDKRLFTPSIQYRTTQSLPSLSQSKMSGKSSRKSLSTKDPQKCSTFDLFKTSRLGRRTASHRQSFAWDFSPRDEEVSLERNENCFPTLGHVDTQSTRPVHLYMSVEMMDKLLEKRKGLRSDATLNALIGLPPSTKKNSNNKTKKKTLKDSPIIKAVRMKVEESKVQEIRPSIIKETTSEESKSEEPKSKEPTSEEPMSEEPKSDNTISEDLHEDEMVSEFEDEAEAELGGLKEEDRDEEFDAAEDEDEDADDEEDVDKEEEEFIDQDDEVLNDSDDDINKDFSGQGRQEDEMPDTAEEMEEDCHDEEGDVGEGLDEQDNDISDDDGDEDLAGQDKNRGTEEEDDDAEEEEEDSDQDDEPVEDDEEGGDLSDEEEEDGQNEASEDDAELMSDDDGDK